MKTLHSRKKSISRSPCRRGFILITLALTCFGLSPTTRAVSPEPDGGYPNHNTAEGEAALFSGICCTVIGAGNTAIGAFALNLNTADNNTATGFGALASNTTGSPNTAMGVQALTSNITGSDNTATGAQALFNNATGSKNTAFGSQALFSATGGSDLPPFPSGDNTAVGYQALYNNRISSGNTAVGVQAMYSTTNSEYLEEPPHTEGLNTVIGFNALYNSVGGAHNIAVGAFAGIGLDGSENWNIYIGNEGAAGESNTIRIGEAAQSVGLGVQAGQTRTFIAGIHGTALGSGVAVRVNSHGQLGTTPSSARFKQNIKPMANASEAILALKPVTFSYKKELDPESIPQFGLVAEEVEKVNPALVSRDAKGEIYTVRYDAVNAMLLNEFLKEHRKVQEQGATIARLQKQVEALTQGLQKVSAQLELNKSAPQTVLNNQ